MKFKTTIYVNDAHFLVKFKLEEYLVGNEVEYHLTKAGNFVAWLTKRQIEQLMDDGHEVNVW